MAVEHFDEGVYASSLWFDASSGGRYPARELYAPPFVPALIKVSLLAEQVMSGAGTRPSSMAAMFPSLFGGCLTLVIVWWVARTWFGSAAAIGATTLAALSEFHALYSRTALTDVLLLPWLLLAVFLFERAVAKRDLRWLAVAGVACGLAWWTKYNGWLGLLITAGGLVLRWAFVSRARRTVGRDAAYWAGFAAVAAIVWSPCLWSLQATGGYRPVMENHAGYVVGLSGWLSSLVAQVQNLAQFEGWLSCLAFPVALVLCLLATDEDRRGKLDLLLTAALGCGLTALAVWVGVAIVLGSLVAGGLLIECRRIQRPHRGHAPDAAGVRNDDLGGWLAASWFLGLFVATPLYSPYPRLTLPWMSAGWLAGGLAIAALAACCERMPASADRRPALIHSLGGRVTLVVLLLIAGIATYAARQPTTDRGTPAWQDRSGIRQAATFIATNVDPSTAIVFVEGEPALFYQLRAGGIVAVPAFDANLSTASLPGEVDAYLATGLHAERNQTFQELLEVARRRLEPVATFAYQPSDLVLLNNFRAPQLETQRNARWEIKLYKVR